MNKLILIIIAFLSVNCFALSEDQEGALQEAKQVLRSPELRSAAIKNDHAAKRADTLATITTMGNKDYKEEMYAISAELLDWVARQQDSEALVKKYQQNPVKFLNEMPPAQAAKIKALADSIEQKHKSRQPASVSQP
jgi:hypothetical protein